MALDYNTKDSLIAIGLYILVVFTYLGLGIVHNERGLYLGIPVNIFLIIICIVFVFIRRQKLSSVGLTIKNLKKSLLLGLVTGIFFSLLNIIPALLAGGRWKLGFGQLIYYIFYYFVIVSFQEEILFRGYIQTRLYGWIKSDTVSVVLCGVLFALMHVPFQLYNRSDGNLIVFLSNNFTWLLMTFTWHLVFNYLYRKYNSLIAPVICHGIMNLSSMFFV